VGESLNRLRSPTHISSVDYPRSRTTSQAAHLISVVHGQSDTRSLEIINVHNDLVATALGSEDELNLAWSLGDVVGGFVLDRVQALLSLLVPLVEEVVVRCEGTNLITESVSSDNDRLDPTGNRFRYSLNDDRFTEYGSIEDISDLIPRTRHQDHPPKIDQPNVLDRRAAVDGGKRCIDSRYRWATSTSAST